MINLLKAEDNSPKHMSPFYLIRIPFGISYTILWLDRMKYSSMGRKLLEFWLRLELLIDNQVNMLCSLF